MEDRESLERRKLELEVARLAATSTRAGRLVGLLPILTALVGLVGLGFGAWRWLAEQAVSRTVRLETQLREDLAAFSAYTADADATVAQLVFLLEDLERLVARLGAGEEEVTAVLTQLVQDGCRFELAHHVAVDVFGRAEWPGYRARVAADPWLRDWLVYQYASGFEHVRAQDTEYFAAIAPLADGSFQVPYKTDESTYQHFLLLYRGLGELAGLLSPEELLAARGRVDLALGNPRVTAALLGSSGLELVPAPPPSAFDPPPTREAPAPRAAPEERAGPSSGPRTRAVPRDGGG